MERLLDTTLTPRARDALLRAGHPRDFAPGEVLFHQGDPSDSLYLLREGRVVVRSATVDGDEVVLAVFAAPDELGELALLRPDHHHTATVVALDDVHVLSVPAVRFHALRQELPELTEWLLETLARRLERAGRLLADALYEDAAHRVARRLLDCARALDLTGPGTLPVEQQDVAAMAGVSRPTANRCLRRLEDGGVVRLRRRRIDVVDLAGLEHAAR